MRKTTTNQKPEQSLRPPKSSITANHDNLHQLAFNNSFQANIISVVSAGKIIAVNKAACKLFGYAEKELLTKSRGDIFDANDSSFKKMLKQRKAKRNSVAIVTAFKKNKKSFFCHVTSAVFMDNDGIEKAVTTVTDMSQSILKQTNIDSKKEKIVSDNIFFAKSKQKKIDADKREIVAGNIVLAKSRQKEIDTKNKKVVADNISIAKSKQKKIDTKNKKVVADNISIAKSKQKKIDTKNKKVVADNISIAKSKQKEIDFEKEKVVADDIIVAQAVSDSRLFENDEWIKHIAKTSYDVMWDWNIVTGEIYVGDSIEEVFGYAVQNNIVRFTDFCERLAPGEKEKVKKKISKALSTGSNSWSDSFSIKRNDGSLAAATSRASIIRNAKGKAIQMIGAIKDVSKTQRLQDQINMQEKQSEKFFLAARLSFDVIWEWNLVTNEMLLGDGYEELFGYKSQNDRRTITDWGDHLHPDDREAIEEGLLAAIGSSVTHWEYAYRFIRADGSIAKVLDRASIIRDANGKAYRLIGAMQDMSKQGELKEKLEQQIATNGKLLVEYKERFQLIFNSSSEILYDIDLVSNEIILSDAYEKDFGYKITGNMTRVEDWSDHIHQDDKDAVIEDFLKTIATSATAWKYSYRFVKADNSEANVLSSAIILRNKQGSAYRMIGSMRDLSKQTVLAEQHEKEVLLKEKQIEEALQEAKDTERSDIGKELHDNVNQLLGVSKLYLDMAKHGGPDTEMYLSRSSEYTITAIEEIRKLTRGLTTDTIKNLGFVTAIENLARDMMEVQPIKILCSLDGFKEDSVNDKFKHNAFRIVQEHLNNIIKHAKASKVTIRLLQDKKTTTLIVKDNGIGFDTSQKRKGIGVANIKSRAVAFSGSANFVSEPGHGCILTVAFPLNAKTMLHQ